MTTDRRYPRHRFPIDVISQRVWLYFRFCLSDRDVEEMIAEQGVPSDDRSGTKQPQAKASGCLVKVQLPLPSYP